MEVADWSHDWLWMARLAFCCAPWKVQSYGGFQIVTEDRGFEPGYAFTSTEFGLN